MSDFPILHDRDGGVIHLGRATQIDLFGPMPENKEALVEKLRLQNELRSLGVNLIDPCGLCAKQGGACLQIAQPEKPYNCGDLQFKDDISNEAISNYLLSLTIFKTMSDTEEIYYYDNGVYKPKGETLIKSFVEVHYRNTSTNRVNEVLAHIQRKTFVDRSEFDSDPCLLTVENGVLDLRTSMLNEFTSNHLSLVKTPVNYNPDAKSPVIDKFLSEIVAPQDVITLYEIAAFILFKRYFIHKSIMQVGDTHSGKSIYQKLLTKLVGEENAEHQSLQLLLIDKFASSNLYGKLVNSFADLSNAALKETGLFKALCGEDRISGQRKFRDSFNFENYAKLIFSTNEMPKTRDKSDAFFIRWLIINFPNRFDDKNPQTDKFLIDKLTTPEELSGFLNQILTHIKNLLANQHFTNNPDVDEIRSYYEKLSNPIYAFISDTCTAEENSHILKKDFYQELMKYCEDKRLSKPTLTFTTQEMKRLRYEEGQDHEGPRYYKRLRFKS